jgi:hypothetical protein
VQLVNFFLDDLERDGRVAATAEWEPDCPPEG